MCIFLGVTSQERENCGGDCDAEDAEWELVEAAGVTEDAVGGFIERVGVAEHGGADPDGPHAPELVEHGVDLDGAQADEGGDEIFEH